jgi:hypothetical protein
MRPQIFPTIILSNTLRTFISYEVNDQASAPYDFMSSCCIVGTHLQWIPA